MNHEIDPTPGQLPEPPINPEGVAPGPISDSLPPAPATRSWFARYRRLLIPAAGLAVVGAAAAAALVIVLTPRTSVEKLVPATVDVYAVANLEWHGHNDFHRGEVNTMAAWLYGCAAANGSLFGFGERTGNPPLEALVIDYLGLTGDATGVDTTAITRAAAYFRDELGTPLPANHPFAGAGFNVTSAGIHADGLLKNEEIYNIFDTARILDRPLGITVNDRSGLAGIAYWLNTTLGLGGPAQVRKDDPRVVAIHREVERQYAAGRSTGFSPDEMAALAWLHFGNAPATSARS